MAQGLERIPLAVDSDFKAQPVRANFPDAPAQDFKLVAFEPDQMQAQPAPASLGVGDTLSSLGRNVWDAVVYHTPAAVAAAVEGDDPYATWDWKDALIGRARQRAQEVSKPGDANTKTAIPGITAQDINSLGPSAGFSAAGAAAGLGAGIPAGMVASPVAGYAAGMAASGTTAYRMATNQFVRDLHDTVNAESLKTTGKPVSPQEFQAKQAQLADTIKAYGLWEAVPEAAGNALSFGILTAPVKGAIGKLFGKNIATRFAGKLGALYGEELATETVTQMGQHNAEVGAGMTKAPRREFTSPTDWRDSFKEVAGPTMLQTTLMAGGFKAGQMAKDRLMGKADQPDNAIPAGDIGAGPGGGGIDGEFIPAGPAPALANQPGGTTYDQSRPELPAGQTMLPRLALPAPEDGGPSERQVSTAIGLLKHSPKASPELLQRLMRVDQTMATMLFNHWKENSNVVASIQPAEGASIPEAQWVARSDEQGSISVLNQAGDRQERDETAAASQMQGGIDPSVQAHAAGTVTPLDVQAHAAATSPFNNTPQPTEAQKAAGNYKVGRIKFQGMDISIENPAGSVRSGKDEDGKAWENTLQHHYGYIKGTVGKDKDHLDVFIKPGAQSARTAYVIDQINPKTGAFDEHKIVFGADSEADAQAIYHANYEQGWQGMGAITAMPIEQFKDWIKSGKTKKPVAYTEPKEIRTASRAPKTASSLLQAIVNRGGISREIMSDVGVDPAGRYMPGLFTKTGTTDLSALAGYLFDEDGFHQIRQDSAIGPARELEDLIVRALGGEKVLSTTAMEKGAQAEETAKLKEKAQRLGVKTVARKLEDIAADVLRIEAQNVLDEETALEDEALVAYNETVDALHAAIGEDDAENFLEALASKYQDETHLNYLRSATADIQEKINEQALSAAAKPDEATGRAAEEGDGTGVAPGGDRASGEEARPSISLSGQSEAEIRAEQEHVAAAEAQRKAEDERAAAAERQARIDAEVAGRQDVAADNFTLTPQVNNKTQQKKADQAEIDRQLAGQGDIFGSNSENQPADPVAESPAPAPSEPGDDGVATIQGGAAADTIAGKPVADMSDDQLRTIARGLSPTFGEAAVDKAKTEINRRNAALREEKAAGEGKPVATKEPAESFADLVKQAYAVASPIFGNDIYPAGVQKDWQKLLDAMDGKDADALSALEAKYRRDGELDGMGSGTAGAGPAKVNQARRGAAQLWRFARAAIDAQKVGAGETAMVAGYPVSGMGDKALAAHAQSSNAADRAAAMAEIERRKATVKDSLTPEKAEQQAEGKIDTHESLFDRLRDGTATLDEFKAGFVAVVAGKEAITAELSKLTKDAIFKRFPGLAYRYKTANKAEIVDAAYRDMASDFALGRSISYVLGFGGDGGYFKAITAMVERTTEDDLAKFAADVKAAKAERAERQKEAEAGMENPVTLDDYKRILGAKAQEIGEGATFTQARMAMTPEQRARFDELSAEKTRAERKARGDQQRADIRVAAATTEGQIIETKHTKTGEPLFVVKAAERVERDVYNHWNATAKKLGGWYSSYRGGGAVPGFQFKTRENADAFLAFIGGNVEQAKEAVQTRRDAFEDDRSQTAVERLTEMADRLEERADESLNRDRKENTDRRARMAASAEAAANSDKSLAKTMRNIAQAIESGKTKFLDRVRQKAQVEMLRGFLHTAKANELRAKFPSYADQEKHRGAAPTAETADYVDFPRYTAFRSDLATMGRQMLDIDGAKKTGAALLKVADDVSAAYLTFAKEHLHQVSTFKTSAGKGAVFASKDDAEAAIKRSGFKGKAVVLPFKRGQNIIIMSPSAAKESGIWKGDDDKRITLSPDFGEEVVAKVKEFSGHRISMPYLFESVRAERARLKSIGIETAAELRAALREFMDLRAAPPEVDKIKQMERAMIGRKNDGLDFFPTPASVADELVQAAGIEEGMAVLEPSAGMGHIAERIRAAGVDPDVVEMASDRRELLEAKGFRLVGADFMDMSPRGFTYGDVFRAPDGTLGVMRGSGGLGSNRVGLDPLDANGQPEPRRMGWYDRDELEGVEKRAGNSGYDRIIMNPPFSDRRDAQHVQHAYTLLKPGGRLVAIMGEGVFFGQDKKAQAFRDWLEEVGGTSEKLEEGTFLDPSLPVNTGVNARMVVVEKGEGGVIAEPSSAAPGQFTSPKLGTKFANAREAVEWLAQNMDGEGFRHVAQKILPVVRSAPIHYVSVGDTVPAKVAELLSSGSAAVAYQAGDITDGKDAIYILEGKGDTEEGLLHEALHIATSRRLLDATAAAEFSDITKAIRSSLYDAGAKSTDQKFKQAIEFFRREFRSPGELVAYGFSSPAFQDLLKLMAADGKFYTDYRTPEQLAKVNKNASFQSQKRIPTPAYSMWHRFVDAVRALFGGPKAYQEVYERAIAANAAIDRNNELASRVEFKTLEEELNRLLDALLQRPEFGLSNGGAAQPIRSSGLESRSRSTGFASTESTRAIQSVVDKFLKQFAGAADLDIRVVRTVADIPERFRPSPFAEGTFNDDAGLIYLVAMNLKHANGQVNTGRVWQVLMHEAVGHAGLAKMMGSRFGGILKEVMRAARAKGEVGEDIYEPGHPDYATVEAVRLRYTTASDEVLAEEVLARMAETDPGRTLFGYVRAVVRQWLRDMARAAGVTLDVTTAELNDLVAQASRYMRRGDGVAQGVDVDALGVADMAVGGAASKMKNSTAAGRAREAEYSARDLGFDDVADLYRKANDAFEKGNYAKGRRLMKEAYDLETPLIKAGLERRSSGLESRAAPTVGQPQQPRTGFLDTILRKAGGELAAKITGPAYDKLTAYLGGKVPEGIKAGMVSDYGLDESYVDRRTGMQTEQQKAARQTKTFVEGLMDLDRAQSRVAYQWLNNRGAEADRLMAQLPQESQQVLKDIKIQIAKLTIEAVRLGQLDAETASRNFLAYLHRSYAKYDLNTDDKTWKAERAKAIKILGDQYKGRGLKMDVDPDRIHSAPGWWQDEMKGKRVQVLKNDAGRFAFVAEGTAIPPNLSGYKVEGVWEIRARKAADRITLWRDFTQDERQMMGELDEAKYAVARTLFMMNRDIEVGRFHEWVADEYAKTPEEAEEEGLQMADASDSMMRAFTPGEWVTVPTSKIPGTGVFKYGALAGMVVPGPVWNDIRQISAGRFEPFGAAYASILRAWKLSKTALTPTTHVNNIMGNFVMADMHDVGARDAIAAVRLMAAAANGDKDAKAMLDRFEDSGATQGMFTTHELKKEVLEPLLQQLREEVGMADDEAAILKASAIMSLALHGQFGEAWAGAKAAAKQSTAGRVTGAVVTKAQDYYQAEDSVFRLAAFLKSVDEGKTDLEAGKLARKAFLDYHINAPWINAMRGTAMPFIAFAYRAIPMLTETAAKKPWKIAKYMLVAGGLNALAYAMLGADADEDKERAYLPEEKAGRLWGIVPKLIRMPWNRESKLRDGKTTSDPVFLDVRRWIPVGDVVDYGQDKTALPMIPQPLIPGGPLIMAAEFLVNKSAFTGKELTKETDTWVEKAAKVGGHFYKGFMPNVPIPYSGTWAGTKIDNAVKGKEDPLGRAYPVPEAIASGFGLKLERYPVDTLQRNAVLDMKGKLRELSDAQRQAARDYGRQGMTKRELDEKVTEIVGKKNATIEEYKVKERKAMGR